MRRLAILPANILVADSSSEWMRIGIPLALAQDLASSTEWIPSVALNESSVYENSSADALRTTIDDRAGRLNLEATVTDVRSQRNKRALSIRSGSLNAVAAVNVLARQLDAHASAFSTQNDRALEAFTLAASSADRQVKEQRLRDAINIDPSFGLAYVALAELLADSKNPESAAVIRTAEPHRSSFTAADRARFDLLRTRLDRKPLAQQIQAAQAAVAVTPNDAGLLSTFASTLFLSNNGTEAMRIMQQALATRPGDPNLRQQLAIGLVEVRQFASAEKIFTSLAGDTSVLPQLATCILLEGDEKRASEVYEKFLASVPNPDARLLLRASWQARTGKLDAAVQAVAAARFSDDRVAELAAVQVTIWRLMLRNGTRAQTSYLPTGVPRTSLGVVAALLSSGASSAAGWEEKVQALPPAVGDESAKKTLTAYGLFLLGFYPEAAVAWQTIEDQSGGSDLPARVMVAASLNASGRAEDAGKVSVQPYIPDVGDPYAPIAFRQLRLLLGQTG